MAEVSDWNPVDDNNNSAPPVGWPEGMVPSAVNNAARAMQGALRREHDRLTAGTLDLPYVKRAGDTMTGNLAVNGTGGLALGATQLQNISNGLQVYNAAGGWVMSRGPTAGYVFGDRNQTSPDWLWYANANVAKLSYNNSVDLLAVTSTGNLAVAGSVNAGLYGIDNLPVIDSDGGGIRIYDNAGQQAIYLTPSATYYKADAHWFQTDASVTTVTIDAVGNLNTSGAVNASGNVNTSAYYLNGVLLANHVADAAVLYDRAGQQTVYMSPGTTYYKNQNHQFQNDVGGNTFQIDSSGNIGSVNATFSGNVTAANFIGNFSGGGGNTVATGTVNSTTVNNSGTITTANLNASSNVTASGTVTGNSMVCGSGVFQNTGPSNLIGQTTFGPSGSYARIDAAGTYNISGSWLTFSDRQAKNAITPYTAGLDAINQLEPVSYTYTSEIEAVPVTRYGLVAQDVAPIVPEMVGEGVTPGGTTMATLNGGHATWLLINAVKELSAKVAALEAQLAAAGDV